MREQDFALLLEIALRLEHGIIAIDGASAVGKTTSAQRIGEHLGTTVISTDSYVTPRAERTISPYDPAYISPRTINRVPHRQPTGSLRQMASMHKQFADRRMTKGEP